MDPQCVNQEGIYVLIDFYTTKAIFQQKKNYELDHNWYSKYKLQSITHIV
jgi:hypothetical protein